MKVALRAESEEKSRGSAGSPQDRRKTATADEELEMKLREMQEQDNKMRGQKKILEDENLAEKVVQQSYAKHQGRTHRI